MISRGSVINMVDVNMQSTTGFLGTCSTTRRLTQDLPVEISSATDKIKREFSPWLSQISGLSGGLRRNGLFKKSYPNVPVITVITVVYNCIGDIERTIESVLNQSYDNIEYIVIDGGSVDGTLDVISAYDNKIDYWFSGKDSGIYDAMNKGIIASTGVSCIFINSGDGIGKDVVLKINNDFDLHSTAVVGAAEYDSGKIFISSNKGMILKNNMHHQGLFCPVDFYKKVGVFNLKYKVLADYDLNLRMFAKNCASLYVVSTNSIVAHCSSGGVSDTPKFRNYREEISIRFSIYGVSFFTMLLSLYSILRFVLKRLGLKF